MKTKKFFDGDIELLKVEDIAETLGVHAVTIRRYIRIGSLKARKIGKRWYISKERFREFVDGAGEQKQVK